MMDLIKNCLDMLKRPEKTLTPEKNAQKIKHQDLHMTQIAFMDEYLQDVREIELEMKQRKSNNTKSKK